MIEGKAGFFFFENTSLKNNPFLPTFLFPRNGQAPLCFFASYVWGYLSLEIVNNYFFAFVFFPSFTSLGGNLTLREPYPPPPSLLAPRPSRVYVLLHFKGP